MLSRSSRSATGLLSRHFVSPCRERSQLLTFLQRNVFIRSQSTDPNGTPPSRPRYRHRSGRRDNLRDQNESRTVELDVDSLGKPGEIVILPHRKGRRRIPTSKPSESSEKSALPFMLDELEKEDEFYGAPLDSTVINERIKSFCGNYQPHDKLAVNDWNDLRSKLQLSFTFQQLADYISEARKDDSAIYEEQAHYGKLNTAVWRPGTSMFLETEPASQEDVADRVAISQALKGKQLLAEKILRDCWKIGVIGEVGQLDIRLPAYSLSLLLYSKHFSFEELASLHEAQIDVTHSLGLVRITGKQHSCESIREIIYDATTRIRQEKLELNPPNDTRAKDSRIFKSEFLSWVSKTYGVAFEEKFPYGPSKIFYLVENKKDADNARRTLNLAIYNTTSSPIPFSTYLPASEPASVYNVDPEHNVSWFDRQKKWFRWAMSSTQASEAKGLDTPFFDSHQSRLSDELLKLLRQTSPPVTSQSSTTNIRESLTAAVGKCLFLRKPTFDDTIVSASQLGRMSLPRTFLTDIPRATSFLRMLTPRPSDDDQQHHLIRLIPSSINSSIFPPLELEVAVNNTSDSLGSGVELTIQSAKAVLTESSVDYLLPENGLDLRFTRKLYLDMLKEPPESGSVAWSTAEAIQSCLQDLLSEYMKNKSELPPVFSHISLPNNILKRSTKDINGDQDPSGYTTGEYMFMPVNDIRGTRIHRYDFYGQRLNYAFYEGGPFNPHRTTDMFLDMDVTDKNSLFSTSSVNEVSRDILHQEFNSFYGVACSLAFELVRAWRMDVG